MAFYYVKNDGTATGDAGRYATKQTGSFATLGTANYYASLEAADAATTAPNGGDYILVSDVHSFNDTAQTYTLEAVPVPPIQIVSVSDTAIDQYSAGATETSDGVIYFYGRSCVYGMTFQINNIFSFGQDNSYLKLTDCTIKLQAADLIRITNDGCIMELFNCTIYPMATPSGLQTSNGGYIRFIGGTVSGDVVMPTLCVGAMLNGGGRIELIGTDLTNVTTYLLENHGAATGDDPFLLSLHGCRLNSGVTFIEESMLGIGTELLITNSASSSAAAEYQYHYQNSFGVVEDQDDAGIHRDESTAYPSGTKASLKITTTTKACVGAPFTFTAPARYVELSTAAQDTLTLYFASTTSLTDLDVWVTMQYPDGTNKHVYNYLSTINSDILSAGTALTTDSGSTWKDGASDLTGYNEYKIDIATSGDPGADGIPIIQIHVALPSTTIYMDTDIDVS